MNKIVSELQNCFPFLEKDDVNLLLSISELREIQNGEMLLKEGELNANVHLVLNGLLRSYVITSAGEERTVFICKEKMRAVSINSILHNRPSTINIEAIEDSTVLIINSAQFQKLIVDNNNLALLEKNGMQYYLEEATERLHLFTVFSPEERFIKLRELHPDLIQRVPQMYLASYLGVTTVSLSRIKARIAKSNKNLR